MKHLYSLGFLKNSGRLALLALAVQLIVSAAGAADAFPQLFSQSDYQPAGLDSKEPALAIDFPGAATTQGISEGTAVVSVAINAEGQATDFMVTSCTEKIFGRVLLDWVKVLKYQPARYRGVAVPGRCDISYHFDFRFSSGGEHKFGFSAWGATSGGLQVGSAMTDDVFNHFSGKVLRQNADRAVAEKNLDRQLEFTDVALPKLPIGYVAPTDKPVKVFVTFYIDAEGKARLPQVESAASPELVAGAIKAVGMWTFKPVTVKGKPALVYTGRSVGFLPRSAVASAQ